MDRTEIIPQNLPAGPRYVFAVALLSASMALGGCDYFRSVSDRIARAEALLAQSEHRAAAIELKNVIDKEPNNPQARLLLANILLFMSDPNAAQRDLDVARKNGANVAQANDVEIRILLTLGRFQDAAAKLSRQDYALSEPNRSLYLARANLGLQRPAEAAQFFDKVLANNPDSQEAQLGKLEARAANGELPAVLDELDQRLKRTPNNAATWSLQGTLQLRGGRLDDARTSFGKAHEYANKQLSIKQHADVLAMLVELNLGARDLAGADQALASLNKILPGTLMTRLLQARIAIAKHDLTNAAAELQRIVRAAPDVAPAQFLLGMVLLQQNNINQAEQHLARAVALAPQHLEARKLLAQAQLRLDRPQAAIQSLMPALDDPGVDLQVHGLLGLAEKQAGLESSSVEYLRQALAKQPDSDTRKLELATAYVRVAKFDDAIALLRSIDDPSLEAQRAALLAAAIARTKGVASARAELETQLARHPNNVTLVSVVADFYGQSGQPQRGVELLSDTLKSHPTDTTLLVSRARLLAMRGDAGGAERDLKSALERKPNDRNVLLALADIAYRRGDIATATSWLDRLIGSEPENIQIQLLKARALLSTKQPAAAQQATELLNKLIAAHTERSDVRSAIARLYVSAGRYEEALAQLRAASAISKQDMTIKLEIARTQVALSQFDDARITVAELLQQNSNWLPAAALASWLDIERHANDTATARMAALRKQLPNDPRAAAAEGEILMAAGKPALAADSFAAAMRTEPSISLAVKTYQARRIAKLPEPTAPLQSYVDKYPHDLDARGALAQAYQQLGDARRAIAQYEVLRGEGVGSPVVLNNLAWLYSEAGDARALPVAREAAALAPNNAAIADTLGWILVKQGKYDEALPVLRSAVAGAPRDAEIRYHLAVVLDKTGGSEDAARVLTELLAQPAAFASRVDAERLQKELSNRAKASTSSD